MPDRSPALRVLHVITCLDDGGAEASLYRLCTHDGENRHVVVSLMDAGKYGPLLRAAGIDVHCLGMPRGRFRPAALRQLWRLLRTQRPDVVQTWMYHADLVGGVVARLAGVRAMCWGVRNTTLEPSSSARGTIWVARACARLSRWVPRTIISCSREAARVHGALGYATDKFVVIPNGYDLTRFAPDVAAQERLRAQWGVAADEPLIGMVARFDPAKDHATLLAALGRFARTGAAFNAVLVGTGMDASNAALRAAISAEKLDRRVRLLGRRDDVPAVMNALDLHVLSSRAEAFPNVLAEAMACGTPCVTTDVGDAALIVGDTGWVVPPRDTEALAAAIGEALRERADCAGHWQARRRAARERVAGEFDIERMVAAYRAVWQAARDGPPAMAGEPGPVQ
jgi:glycosyltransferase involved in cell wall biosynthesis